MLKTNIISRVLRKLKIKCRHILFDLGHKYFRIVPGRVKRAKGVKVIVFHGVAKDHPFKFNSRFVSVDYFEEQVLLLKQFYNLIGFNDFVSGNFSDSKLNVLITFDDGLKNNYDYAVPILKKHGVPAVLFTTLLHLESQPFILNDITDIIPLAGAKKITLAGEDYARKKIFLNYRYVNKQNVQLGRNCHRYGHSERMSLLEEMFKLNPLTSLESERVYFELMNEKELLEISNHPLFEVGLHGAYHTDLSTLNETSLNAEIQKATAYLKRLTGKKAVSLAFPYGAYTKNVIKVCQLQGVSHLFGTEIINDADDRNFVTPRLQLNPFISPICQMYYIAKGYHE